MTGLKFSLCPYVVLTLPEIEAGRARDTPDVAVQIARAVANAGRGIEGFAKDRCSVSPSCMPQAILAVLPWFAEQLASVPPPEPVQDHIQGPEPPTEVAAPIAQRLAVGAEETVLPLAEPHAPFSIEAAPVAAMRGVALIAKKKKNALQRREKMRIKNTQMFL